MGPCPTCGTVNKVSARFCTKCGTPLAGPTARIEASDQDPAAPPAANPPGAQPAQSSAAPVSPNQPAASGPTAQVPSPGAVPPTATVPPPVGAQSASAPSIACPHCGTPNRMGARICKKCGKSLSAAPVGASGSFPPTPIPVAPPVPPVPPAPPAPVPQMAVPSLGAAKRPPRPPFVAIGVLVLLVLGLCSGLGAVFYLEGTSPTATVAAVVPPTPTPTLTPTIPPRPTAIVAPTQTPTATPNPPFPVVMLLSTADGRFGFATKQGDPANANDDNKPLTYRKEKSTEPADGSTSNTRISIDGQTPLYGGKEGRFISPPSRSSDDSQLTAAWQYGSIVVTETVKVVLSSSTHRLDTFEIRYDAENRDTQSHNVGVRLMLDTLIGDNDGVPFNVPGIGLVQTPLQLSGDKIPNFVQVYENADVANPGVTLQMTLTGGEATAPDRFVIAPWCNKDESWDFWAESGAGKNSLNQCGNMTKKGDSSVGIYFDPKPLAAGETRHWTTFYGLGEIKPVVVPGAKLGVPNPPAEVKVGEEFWVTALVQNPKPGQTVKLIFPAEFQLTDGTAEQTVDAKGATQVQLGWRLRAVKPGGNLALHVVLNPDNAAWDGKVSVIQLPTPTPLPPTLTPTKCATTVTHPICP